jgi:DNA-binding transcriptional MocR family regulator
MSLQDRLSIRARGRRSPSIRELLGASRVPGMISLAGGWPGPANAWAGGESPGSVSVVLEMELAGRKVGRSAVSLPGPPGAGPDPAIGGSPELVDRIRGWHGFKSGLDLDADQICVTAGPAESLFAIAYLFLDPGDAVALAEPADPSAIAAFGAFTDNFLAIPQDRLGLIPRALSEYVKRRQRKGLARPKLVYACPTCQNPSGASMDAARRRELYDVVRELDLLLVEDDPYELLRFQDPDSGADGEPAPGRGDPAIQSLDTDGQVVRVDSLSGVILPGLRVGYVSGPREIVREVRRHLEDGSGLSSSALDQALLVACLDELGPPGVLGLFRDVRDRCRAACEVLLDALDREMCGQVSYNRPDGGFFLWLEFKEAQGPVDTYRMVGTLAEVAGVLAVPGAGFALAGSLSNCLRLAYGGQPGATLTEAVRRLSGMLSEYRRRQAEEPEGHPRLPDA